jgi:rubrerythrin
MYHNQYMMCDMNLLEKSLEGIKAAVASEQEDELFYDYLISLAPTEEEKDIIASIRDDERGHNKMFRQIYRSITGVTLPPASASDEEFIKPASYLEGIKKALFGELSAVEKYREIRMGLPTTLYRDMLFNIITDEIKHSAKYNYLFTLNSHAMPTPAPMKMEMEMDMNMKRTKSSSKNPSKSHHNNWTDYMK